ncbi:MAG: nucleotidyltransferase domain-containing protein [Opitutales bacterium]|nr:nucleotidyltransferase domain-containing protein [Opitutales bacterium]
MPATENNVTESLAFLANDPDLLLGLVFGSSATGKCRFNSDIDVALYPRHRMDARKRQKIVDDIAVACGRSVDLVDLSTADGALLRQILASGILIFSKDPGILGALSERMLLWQEDFEPQLNEILEARIQRFTSSRHGS